jgi:hypothetical protein
MKTLTIEIPEPGDEHACGFDVVDGEGRRCNVLSWDEIAVTAPTPTITEAARMALDALTEIDGAVIALLSSLAYRDPGPDSPGEKVRASITALRTALSAPATTRGGWFIDAGQSNIGALWQQVEAGTDGAVWLSSALSAVPPLPDDTIAAALADPACTRLREWAAIGPVQRAAVQSFADRLAAAPSVPAGWVDAVMEQAQVFASAHPQEDRPHG